MGAVFVIVWGLGVTRSTYLGYLLSGTKELIYLADNELGLINGIRSSNAHILSDCNNRSGCLLITRRNKDLIADPNCRVICSVVVRAVRVRERNAAEGVNLIINASFFSFDMLFFLEAL